MNILKSLCFSQQMLWINWSPKNMPILLFLLIALLGAKHWAVSQDLVSELIPTLSCYQRLTFTNCFSFTLPYTITEQLYALLSKLFRVASSGPNLDLIGGLKPLLWMQLERAHWETAFSLPFALGSHTVFKIIMHGSILKKHCKTLSDWKPSGRS